MTTFETNIGDGPQFITLEGLAKEFIASRPELKAGSEEALVAFGEFVLRAIQEKPIRMRRTS